MRRDETVSSRRTRRRVFAAAVVLALTLAVFLGTALRDRSHDVGGGSAAPQVSTVLTRTPRLRAAAPVAPREPVIASDLPARNVDLARVDRELDLHGIVRAPDGGAISGAVIEATVSPWRDLASFNVAGYNDRLVRWRTLSGDDGTFALRLPRGSVVDLDVFAAGRRHVLLPRRRAGEFVKVTLDVGVRLAVTVRDENGKPASGLPVRAIRGRRYDESVMSTRVTDAHGKCEFDGLPPGLSVFIESRTCAPYVFPTLTTVLPLEGAASIDVCVRRGAELSGTVVDESGVPICGADVAFTPDFEGAETTDASGRFALSGWTQQADGEIHARAAGHVTEAIAAKDRATVVLRRAVCSRGRVVDACGRHVPGALVSVVGLAMIPGRPQRISGGHAIADDQGEFVIDGIDGALPHGLIAWAAGHARLLRAIPVGSNLELGDVVLPEARRVYGRAADMGGAAVPRATVQLLPGGAESELLPPGLAHREMATDDLGRFEFAEVAPGSYRLVLRTRGRTELVRDVTVGADGLEVDFVVESAREVEIRTVDEHGQPVAGVAVVAISSAERVTLGVTGRGGTLRTQVAFPCPTLTTMPIRGGAAFVAGPPAVLAASQDRITLSLVPASELSGVLLDPLSSPIPGASIAIRQQGRSEQFVRTNSDGRFVVAVAAGSPVEAVFDGVVERDSASGAAVAEDLGCAVVLPLISPDSRDVVLRCEAITASRSVHVRAVTPTGRPLASATVIYSLRADPHVRTVRADDDGRVTLPGLTARSIRIGGVATAEFSVPAPLDVNPGDQTVELRWRESCLARALVRCTDGAIPAGAVYRASCGEYWSDSGEVPASGELEFHPPRDGGVLSLEVHGSDVRGTYRGLGVVELPSPPLLVITLTRR